VAFRSVSVWCLGILPFGMASCRRVENNTETATVTLRPLNLVAVTIDTLRLDYVRRYGYLKIETPSIDGDHPSSGLLFENAVTRTR